MYCIAISSSSMDFLSFLLRTSTSSLPFCFVFVVASSEWANMIIINVIIITVITFLIYLYEYSINRRQFDQSMATRYHAAEIWVSTRESEGDGGSKEKKKSFWRAETPMKTETESNVIVVTLFVYEWWFFWPEILSFHSSFFIFYIHEYIQCEGEKIFFFIPILVPGRIIFQFTMILYHRQYYYDYSLREKGEIKYMKRRMSYLGFSRNVSYIV